VAESHSRIDAVTKVKNHAVNLVLIDIGASDADRTLKRLREVLPEIPVILIGMLTFSNVRASMEALLLGAVEFIPTPTPHAANTDRRSFERNLVEILSGLHEREKPTPAPLAPSRPVRQEVRPQPTKPTPPNITLAKLGTKKPRVLLIGSSTGGPKAVTDVLEKLRKPFPLPILITQHMPPGFTATFATNIQRRTGHTASEGKENELVQPGRVYIAPGGLHQILIRKGIRFTFIWMTVRRSTSANPRSTRCSRAQPKPMTATSWRWSSPVWDMMAATVRERLSTPAAH